MSEIFIKRGEIIGELSKDRVPLGKNTEIQLHHGATSVDGSKKLVSGHPSVIIVFEAGTNRCLKEIDINAGEARACNIGGADVVISHQSSLTLG